MPWFKEILKQKRTAAVDQSPKVAKKLQVGVLMKNLVNIMVLSLRKKPPRKVWYLKCRVVLKRELS
jgi:hypothetical protein